MLISFFFGEAVRPQAVTAVVMATALDETEVTPRGIATRLRPHQTRISQHGIRSRGAVAAPRITRGYAAIIDGVE